MILLRSGENTVVLTLNEKRSLDDTIFMFKFVNDLSNKVYPYFTSPDLSTVNRYNEFLITCITGLESPPLTEDLLLGQIDLTYAGYWTYTVYEIAATSPQTLTEQDIIKEVESGKLLFEPTITQVDSDFTDGDDDEDKIFDQ